MNGSRPLACLLAAVFAWSASGCSFRLARPAPPRKDWPDPVLPSSSEERCTESPLPVAADAVFGAIGATLSYVERDSGSPKIAMGIGIASIPMLISAVYGAVTVTRCRSYKARFRDAAAAGSR